MVHVSISGSVLNFCFVFKLMNTFVIISSSLLRKRILQFEQNKSTKHEDEIKEAIEIEHESKHHGDKAINKEWTDISHPALAGNSEDH